MLSFDSIPRLLHPDSQQQRKAVKVAQGIAIKAKNVFLVLNDMFVLRVESRSDKGTSINIPQLGIVLGISPCVTQVCPTFHSQKVCLALRRWHIDILRARTNTFNIPTAVIEPDAKKTQVRRWGADGTKAARNCKTSVVVGPEFSEL